MEQANKECKTLSKMWRESGKQMPFKQFATLYNNGELEAYFQKETIKPNKKSAVPIETIVKETACPKKQSNTTTYLQIAAVGFIILGAVYLITKKKN